VALWVESSGAVSVGLNKVHLSITLVLLHRVRLLSCVDQYIIVYKTMVYKLQVTVAVKDNGWDGKDETDESALQWSFAGALLYAVTVVTTIGQLP